jgi:hypothetical protein
MECCIEDVDLGLSEWCMYSNIMKCWEVIKSPKCEICIKGRCIACDDIFHWRSHSVNERKQCHLKSKKHRNSPMVVEYNQQQRELELERQRIHGIDRAYAINLKDGSIRYLYLNRLYIILNGSIDVLLGGGGAKTLGMPV